MFSYKKVEIQQVLKVAPKETYKDTLVIGEIYDDLEDFEVDNHYFLIEDTIVYDKEGAHQYSGYMKAYFPSRIIDEMYLYLVKSQIEDYEMFFIDPLVYESTTDSELEILLLETIEQIDKKNYQNLLDSLYLKEVIFYELNGKSRKKYGHQFITNDLVLLLAKNKKVFYDNYSFDCHKEPITYKLNNRELIFIGSDDLESHTFRLLQLNEKDILVQKKRIHLDDAINFFKLNNYSVRDLMNVHNITKELEMLRGML